MVAQRQSKPCFSDVQQPLDSQNLRSPADRNHSVSAADSRPADWPRTAEAALPIFMQVVNAAATEATTVGSLSEHDIELIVARQNVRWPIPPQLFHTAVRMVADYCQSVHDQEPAIKAFFSQPNPGGHPNTIYEVFHHGQSHVCYNAVPAELLVLRDTILFWIDHSKNELWSCGQALEHGERLQPKAEAMLRFLCTAEHAGQRVSLTDVAAVVWGPDSLPNCGSMRNNISVQQNAINTMAARDFVVAARRPAQTDEKTIIRLRGEDAFAIGPRAHEALCIIRRLYP